MRQPALFIPHGGGPCFFMDWDPPDAWARHRAFLEGLPGILPGQPRALLVISAHWEAPRFTVQRHPATPLLFDYGGFPPHTYQLTWPAPGSIGLAERAAGQALAPLRDQGVLIIGSGNSYHNMQVMMHAWHTGSAVVHGLDFDAWLSEAVSYPDPTERNRRMLDWLRAPGAREAAPREEHLIPLLVAAGAAGSDSGAKIFEDRVMGAVQSAFRFG
jgi:aromatic ring-opening dioxygenase catalytic subunit (LigB family)